MPDNSPRPFDGKLALIAPFTVGGVVAGMLIAAAFFTDRPDQPPAAPAPAPQPAPLTAAPKAAAPPPLRRPELITTAMEAASAAASGAAPRSTAALVGRAFVLRIPFGCPGVPAAETAQAVATFDPEGRTVRLSARPAVWTTTPLVQGLPNAAEIESVEGFWLPRPWALAEGCPPSNLAPPPATPTSAAASTLGFASLHEAQDSRVAARRERPYEFVRRLAADDLAAASHGYSLLLEGRLAAFADGNAIRCWVESPNHRPICLYATDLTRVAFEDADTGASLTEWRLD